MDPPLSIEAKKVPVALYLTSQWCLNDVIATNTRIHWVLLEIVLPENPRNIRFWCLYFKKYWLLKVNGHDIIHRKFKVHCTICLDKQVKRNIERWHPLPLTLAAYSTLPQPKVSSCSPLDLSVLASRKKSL